MLDAETQVSLRANCPLLSYILDRTEVRRQMAEVLTVWLHEHFISGLLRVQPGTHRDRV
jgi:hypothetical protein